MSSSVQARGTHDLPTWVRRSWVVPLAIGLAAILFGVILLVNIGAGIATLRWLVVISLVVAAFEAFATGSSHRRGRIGWLVGVLYLAGALVGIFWPAITLQVLAITTGLSLLVAGIMQIGMALGLRKVAHGWVWALVHGVLAVIGGLLFVFGNPVISILVLVVVLAVYLISTGATLLAVAFAVRRLADA